MQVAGFGTARVGGFSSVLCFFVCVIRIIRRMKDFNSDLFEPGTVMDSETDLSRVSTDADFGFAFNDSNFSDRILRIEIMDDPVEARPDAEGCTTIADWARHRKRRREDIKKENGISLLLFHPKPPSFFFSFSIFL